MKKKVSVLITISPILHRIGKAFAEVSHKSFSGLMEDALEGVLKAAVVDTNLPDEELRDAMLGSLARINYGIDKITATEAKKKSRSKK
jgi:hypothetical protein